MFAKLKQKIVDEGAELSPGPGGPQGGPGYAIPKETNRSDNDSDKNSTSSPAKPVLDSLAKKDGANGRKSLENQIKELHKEREDNKRSIMVLEGRLKEAEAYRERIFKREEEREEQEGLASQELAKVKHLLINAQNERDTALKHLEEEKEISSDRKFKLENLQKAVETSRSSNPPDINTLHEEKDFLLNELSQLKKEHSEKIEKLNKKLENLKENLRCEEKSNKELKEKLESSISNSNSERSKIENIRKEYEKELKYLKQEIVACNSEKVS